MPGQFASHDFGQQQFFMPGQFPMQGQFQPSMAPHFPMQPQFGAADGQQPPSPSGQTGQGQGIMMQHPQGMVYGANPYAEFQYMQHGMGAMTMQPGFMQHQLGDQSQQPQQRQGSGSSAATPGAADATG